MFGISRHAATMLSFPATYATAFGFIYAYGKLMLAMSKSALLPRCFGWVTSDAGTPYFALIAGSAVGYVVCLLVYFSPFIGRQLYNVCILSGFIAYMAQCVGYMHMKTRFGHLPRKYYSPLGVYGAAYSFVVSLLGAIGVAAFQGDQQFAVITLVIMCALLSVYYFAVVKHTQTFSEEERQLLFIAHVANCKYKR